MFKTGSKRAVFFGWGVKRFSGFVSERMTRPSPDATDESREEILEMPACITGFIETCYCLAEPLCYNAVTDNSFPGV